MATLTLVGYARDRTGAGIGTAQVQAYALTDLNTNAKSAAPVASAYPSSSTGRWVLTVDMTANPSPTGLYSVKLTNGTDIRWIEPDAVLSTQTLVGAYGAAPLGAGSITDALIGSRTLAQATVPAGNSGDLTTLLSGVVHQVQALHGRPNWFDAPTISLSTLASHAARHASGGADALTPTQIGAAAASHSHVRADLPASLDATTLGGNAASAFALANHTHASGGVTAHSHVGSDVTSAVANANALGGVSSANFAYFIGAASDGVTLNGPLKMNAGSASVQVTNGISASVNFPSAFGSLKLLLITRGSNEGYAGSITPNTSSAASFTFATADSPYTGPIRVNYLAFGV